MNELYKETSPYLLQHKNNPIHWKAWNDQALAQAKQQNKLLVVSVGYSACHWCHVMEEECFEDHDVAKVMNQYYVSIKVDREERPDVDAIYMKALQLMTKQGGWPLNVVCLPDGRPIWGATYVNKNTWTETLLELQELFENQLEKVLDYAEKLQAGIAHLGLVKTEETQNLDLANLDLLVKKWERSFDWDYGGPARAPKFMMPTNLNFLQNYAVNFKNSDVLKYVDLTLVKMAQGGLFDVVEGGFSRYSVDLRWHIPHFEKMLYDNGQLLQTYASAYKRTHNKLYQEVCLKTIEFIKNNWLTTNGLIYSAYDADSINAHEKLQEGAFYFWTKTELAAILGPDFAWFEVLYNVNEFGLWEDDVYVLIQSQSREQVAEQFNMTHADLSQKNNEALQKLNQYRQKNRKLPRIDDKCLTSWNAIWVLGVLECYEAFKDESLLTLAKNTLNSMIKLMLDEDSGILYRNYKNENRTISGFLDDYAITCQALIKMYQNTLNTSYVNYAKQLTDYCLDHFYNKEVGLFEYKNKTDQKLIAKHFETEDNVIPSSNALMGQNLWILHLLYENKHYQETALKMIATLVPNIDYASAYSEWLQLLLWVQNDFEHLIFTGENAQNLVKHQRSLYNANAYVFGTASINNIPIYQHKFDATKNQKFVCTNTQCLAQQIV